MKLVLSIALKPVIIERNLIKIQIIEENSN